MVDSNIININVINLSSLILLPDITYFLSQCPPTFICQPVSELPITTFYKCFYKFSHALLRALFSRLHTHVLSFSPRNRFNIPFASEDNTVLNIPLNYLDLFRSLKRDFNHVTYSDYPDIPVHNSYLQYVEFLNSLDDIVIFKADKSNAWVLLNRLDYVEEGLRQLSDCSFYKPLSKPVHTFAAQRVRIILKSLFKKHFLTNREYEYFLPSVNYKCRYFYMLPKIHKSFTVWNNYIPPGRPVVSDVNTETSKICSYIDYFLQPLMLHIPSYLKDTDHLIAILENTCVNSSDFLFTCDVTSLYTNISTEKGLNCVKDFFIKYPNPQRPSNSILSLLSICLRYNDFIFNDTYFLQVKGCAMGRKFSPAYANIFMHFWEQDLFSKSLLKPSCWLRYIDDIIGIWPHGIFDFINFITLANSINTDIILTPYLHNTCVDFLDVSIHIVNNRFEFSSFIKPTNNLKIIPCNSFHPAHVSKGVILSTLTRLARRNSNKIDFHLAVKKYFKVWHSQGYSFRFLRSCKYLVINNLGLYDTFHLGFFSCSRIFCKYCAHSIVTSSFHHNGIFHRINKRITCDTVGAIYFIFCSVCKCYVYIGETGEPLRLRIANHLSSIKRKVDHVVSNHFNSLGHNISHFYFTGINFHANAFKRKNLEFKYLVSLKPVLNVASSNIPKSVSISFPYSYRTNILCNNLSKRLRQHNILSRISFSKGARNLKSLLHRKF